MFVQEEIHAWLLHIFMIILQTKIQATMHLLLNSESHLDDATVDDRDAAFAFLSLYRSNRNDYRRLAAHSGVCG